MANKGAYQIMKCKLKDWDRLCLICFSCCMPLSNKETQIEGLAHGFTLQAT